MGSVSSRLRRDGSGGRLQVRERGGDRRSGSEARLPALPGPPPLPRVPRPRPSGRPRQGRHRASSGRGRAARRRRPRSPRGSFRARSRRGHRRARDDGNLHHTRRRRATRSGARETQHPRFLRSRCRHSPYWSPRAVLADSSISLLACSVASFEPFIRVAFEVPTPRGSRRARHFSRRPRRRRRRRIPRVEPLLADTPTSFPLVRPCARDASRESADLRSRHAATPRRHVHGEDRHQVG